MSIRENLQKLRKTLPEDITLVAVSKTKPPELIMEAYEAGHRIFGENKVQELIAKQPELPDDIEWHFIGHMQTNKVKFLVPFIHMIHGVDSLKLLKEINKRAAKQNRRIQCLLQFHIAEEETKFGLSYPEAEQILSELKRNEFTSIRLSGVMGMATFTDDENQIRKEFRYLHDIFSRLKSTYFTEDGDFRIISMGMSGDYRIAIEEGSNMVRIGTAIFGERNVH
ncbi:MAG: YggS family pyridoxal phosphate-dependent enzyme [bacterium]